MRTLNVTNEKIINHFHISKTPVFRSTNIDINTPDIEIKRKFDKYGFVTIPKVVDSQKVNMLRNYVEDAFKSGNEISTREFFLNSLLYSIPFEDRIVNAFKLLLGEEDIAFYPTFTVRKNIYSADWHIDGAFVGSDNLLQSNNFKQLQCVLYLQKNSERLGGGLDVVPGTHNLLFNRFKNNNKITNWFFDFRNSHYEPISIDYELGDLIIFHSRLIHRGTQYEAGVNLENDKYGIFWSASKNDDAHISRHRNFFRKTYNEIIELNNSGEKRDTLEQYKIVKSQLRYKNLLNFKFPDNYPVDVRNFVLKHNINIVNLSST